TGNTEERREGWNCSDSEAHRPGKTSGPTSRAKNAARNGALLEPLVDIEVEYVCDLEVRPVYQDEISADKDVHVIWRRRGKRDFQFMRTRLHSGAKVDRHCSVNDQEALLPGRKAIAPGQAGR